MAVCSGRAGLWVVPAETLALFFGDLFGNGQGQGAAVLPASSDECVQQRNGRRERDQERSGFDRREKDFIAHTGQRREISIGNADAIGAVLAGLLGALDRLPESAAKAYGDDQVAFVR